MKISHYNQLLAILTLLSGTVIFVSLWHQYQKIEQVSRGHYESRLLMQTVDHVFTMSQLWLTSQDLLFSGRQTYLAKGIHQQSEQLKKTLVSIKDKQVYNNSDNNLLDRLIIAIEQNNQVIYSFSKIAAQQTDNWQTTVAESDRLTSGFIVNLEKFYQQVVNDNKEKARQLAEVTDNFFMLCWVVISIYLLFVIFMVSSFSKYIVKPIEKITKLAQQEENESGDVEFRQVKAATEIVQLSKAIQQFTQHITIERNIAEQERLNVIKANDKANVIMDTIPCSIILVDEQGLIKECNIETEQLLLDNKTSIIGKRVSDFVPALANLDGGFDRLGALKHMEESLLAPSFANPHIEFSGREIEIKGQINYLITLIDINERKHSQKALSSLNDQLVHAEKLASIGQLSAGIAHEINNPVGFIRSNLDVLDDYLKSLAEYIELAKQTDKQAQASAFYKKEDLDFVLQDIKPLISSTLEGAARVSKIIKDLGSYAHVDEKLPEDILIDELIEKSLTLVANELKYKVDITKHLEANVNVSGFPQKLLQVFINMLVNASHAIETKGSICISSQLEQDQVRIRFEDNGSGIAKDDLKNIFDPFFTTKPVGKGTGLGLHIVRSIIEEHGGHIDVSSIVGKGSIFTIYLPRQTASQVNENYFEQVIN
ncbi:ATP-binding protein [Colwelliaceae bacterium MEBiC 14330]